MAGRWRAPHLISSAVPPYAAVASKGALHLVLDALHSAGAYANFTGNFVHAFTCAQLLLDVLFNLLAYAGRRPSVFNKQALVREEALEEAIKAASMRPLRRPQNM